jgi:hypothetical protein
VSVTRYFNSYGSADTKSGYILCEAVFASRRLMKKALMIGIGVLVPLLVIILITYHYYKLGVAADDAVVARKLAARSKRSLGDIAPANCPVAKPLSPPFIPPPPWSDQDGDSVDGREFWYGSYDLWTALPRSGTWKGLHLNYARTTPVYSLGVLWGRKGYDRHREPRPNLRIKGRRLGAQAGPLVPGQTGACCKVFDGPEPPPLMDTAFDLPTLGCWEITGRYKGQSLRFVVWATDKE